MTFGDAHSGPFDRVEPVSDRRTYVGAGYRPLTVTAGDEPDRRLPRGGSSPADGVRALVDRLGDAVARIRAVADRLRDGPGPERPHWPVERSDEIRPPGIADG